MYNIEAQSIQKLVEINKLLNILEVKGATNVSALYTSMVMMQEVLNQVENSTKNIVIDGTRGEK